MATVSSAPESLMVLHFRVSELLDRYASHVDHGRLDEWAALFAEESRYEVRTRENVEAGNPIALVLDDSKDRILDRITVIRKFWRGHHDEQYVRHLWSALRIEDYDDCHVTATSNVVVHGCRSSGRPFVLAMGEATDDIELGPELRFRSRVVVLDHAAVDGAFIDPI